MLEKAKGEVIIEAILFFVLIACIVAFSEEQTLEDKSLKEWCEEQGLSLGWFREYHCKISQDQVPVVQDQYHLVIEGSVSPDTGFRTNESLTIGEGGTLLNRGTISNTGFIRIESGGTIYNYSEIHNISSDNANEIMNIGRIFNSGILRNNDSFSNFGIIYINKCAGGVIDGSVPITGSVIDLDRCEYLPLIFIP